MNVDMRRDPVMIVATVTAALQAASLLFGFTTEQQGALNATLVALAGLVSAALVAAEGALPLLVGASKAVLALVLAFGGHVPDNIQVGVMTVITVIAGLAVRDRVVAPVPLRLPASAPTVSVQRQTGTDL